MNESAMSCPSKVILNDDACYKVVDGEAVILDIQSGEYFNLNHTGTEILERAVAGKSIDQIADEMKSIYSETANNIETDVKELIQALINKNILLPAA